MPRGGYRPGAGRPRKDGSKGETQPEEADKTVSTQPRKTKASAAPITSTTYDQEDPAYILALVVQGESKLPTGQTITPAMISAAKELLPYYKAKLSTTNKLNSSRGPVEEVSTEDLRRERSELIAALATLDKELAGKTDSPEASGGRGQRVDPEADGENELFNLLQ